MDIKEYIEKAHRIPLISDDPNEEDPELYMKQRGIMSYHVDMAALDKFEHDFNSVEIDYNKKPIVNTAIHGPQGKKGSFDGIKFDSVWEYAYYRWKHDVKGEIIERNTTENLVYYDNGIKRKFYPDFKVTGGYVEVKGIWREADLQKQAQHPEVEFIDATGMKPIIKELNNAFPHWRDDYITN